MDKGTENSKLEELEQALDAFCAREYRSERNPMTGKNFCLYAVDCGGYDVTGEVLFNITDGECTITVATKRDGNYKTTESKTFKLGLIEDE